MKLYVAAILALFLVAPVSGQSTGSAGKPKSTAELAFDRLKTIVGEWDGRSTKGWEDTNTFQLIAGGSVLMCRSFDSHPNETMVTMYHLDGDELVLTHYCVARNQPRLRATSISPDARTIELTFRDATNLPSRDKGHMDRVVMTFIDDDHFTSQWTWYQGGKEQWLEKIEYVRRKPGQPRPGTATFSAADCHDVGGFRQQRAVSDGPRFSSRER
ncbi:MAG: hypothetical protein IPF82_14900 [Blastocatellia bacterium]|nr:hypothetical protein [Blastocatellia bacterium]